MRAFCVALKKCLPFRYTIGKPLLQELAQLLGNRILAIGATGEKGGRVGLPGSQTAVALPRRTGAYRINLLKIIDHGGDGPAETVKVKQAEPASRSVHRKLGPRWTVPNGPWKPLRRLLVGNTTVRVVMTEGLAFA
nr:hypothetical protein [Bradyrhizobium genosp. SA-3]